MPSATDGHDQLDAFMRATARPWSPPGAVERPRPVEIVSTLQAEPPRVKPLIKVVKREIHRAVNQAVAVLSNRDFGIFSRADELVRPVTHRTPSQTLTVAKQGENVSRPDGSVIVTALTEAALIEVLTETALFMKFNLRVNDFVPCDCPPEVAKMVLARKGHNWTMPRLKAVISAPTLRHGRYGPQRTWVRRGHRLAPCG
ncbi:hypothetical protein NKJ23_25615 [Mesorhizobium sp. M0184]|uniref:hypothetical protein n=1 Tax=Mesorhizobium sp. M0184 TaxID=2956906 RepID=UPI00333CE097